MPTKYFKNIVILISVLITLISCKSNNKDVNESQNMTAVINSENLKIEILKAEISMDNIVSINLNIKNKSKNCYSFPVGNIAPLYGKYDGTIGVMDPLFGWNIKFLDKDKKLLDQFRGGHKAFYSWDSINKRLAQVEYKQITDGNKKFPYWYIFYDNVKKHGFTLKPNESRVLEIKSLLTYLIDSREYENSGIKTSDLLYLHRGVDRIPEIVQIHFELDSNYVKEKILLKNDIESLKKNNVKIFHGKIESNYKKITSAPSHEQKKTR